MKQQELIALMAASIYAGRTSEVREWATDSKLLDIALLAVREAEMILSATRAGSPA
jgi:hypothetical protein